MVELSRYVFMVFVDLWEIVKFYCSNEVEKESSYLIWYQILM